MKIVILDGHVLNPGDMSFDGIAEFGELTVYPRTKPEEIIQRAAGAEVVYTNKVLLTADVLKQLPDLRFIGVLATGYNVVDVAYAHEHGILVANIPAYSTFSVAQFAFAFMLELSFNVAKHSAAVHDGVWSAQQDFSFRLTPLSELTGKTLGLIGFGSIGQNVAKIALAMGMNVIAFSPSQRAHDVNGVSYVTLDELFAKADIISLHCPQTPSNAGMINSGAIAKMKIGTWLINTARGGLVDERAVRDALDLGRLGAYAADVTAKEPIPADSPLIGAPNCLITPHIAWAPKQTRARLIDIATKNLRGYVEGQPINLV